jgi:hypothetical protein
MRDNFAIGLLLLLIVRVLDCFEGLMKHFKNTFKYKYLVLKGVVNIVEWMT